MNDSAFQSEHDRVGPVTRAQFGKDTFDVSFDCMFRNGKLIRNEFVGVTAPINSVPRLPARLRSRLRHGLPIVSDLRLNMFASGVYGPDRLQQIFAHHALQNVSTSACLECPVSEYVAAISG